MNIPLFLGALWRGCARASVLKRKEEEKRKQEGSRWSMESLVVCAQLRLASRTSPSLRSLRQRRCSAAPAPRPLSDVSREVTDFQILESPILIAGFQEFLRTWCLQSEKCIYAAKKRFAPSSSATCCTRQRTPPRRGGRLLRPAARWRFGLWVFGVERVCSLVQGLRC